MEHITDNKLKHIRAVAEECYRLSISEYGLSEEEAQKAYVIGFNHDIGYAFSVGGREHAIKGMQMINLTFGSICMEIGAHGNPETPK